MSLESGIDGEAASCGVHAGHILHIVNLLESQFGTVVPVVVVQVLREKMNPTGRVNTHVPDLYVNSTKSSHILIALQNCTSARVGLNIHMYVLDTSDRHASTKHM